MAGKIDEERAEHVAIRAVGAASDFFDSVPWICSGDIGEGMAFRVDPVDKSRRAVIVALRRDHSYLPAFANDPAQQHIGKTDARSLEAAKVLDAHQHIGRPHPSPRLQRTFRTRELLQALFYECRQRRLDLARRHFPAPISDHCGTRPRSCSTRLDKM
ncbi:hypothetical protein EN879_31560 [Mesorhizobium sp. M7A.F.Ca.AU.002.02.1.1]|uniref:hypothetical protein n=1 Tax=unclassified Mesorhizobium TaxID=325217 RepID=UPI000FCB52F8|nr:MULTISPECIES: hypothetical protein [unclassified Mesorhizobium]RVC17566.1 hypothetical protein EN879_31560 [Mesorhizobium sp. M7A.F.Ca.AU.002.02.1.1]